MGKTQKKIFTWTDNSFPFLIPALPPHAALVGGQKKKERRKRKKISDSIASCYSVEMRVRARAGGRLGEGAESSEIWGEVWGDMEKVGRGGEKLGKEGGGEGMGEGAKMQNIPRPLRPRAKPPTPLPPLHISSSPSPPLSHTPVPSPHRPCPHNPNLFFSSRGGVGAPTPPPFQSNFQEIYFEEKGGKGGCFGRPPPIFPGTIVERWGF